MQNGDTHSEEPVEDPEDAEDGFEDIESLLWDAACQVCARCECYCLDMTADAAAGRATSWRGVQASPGVRDEEVQAAALSRQDASTQCHPPEASAAEVEAELQSPELAAFLRRIVPWWAPAPAGPLPLMLPTTTMKLCCSRPCSTSF